MEIICLNKLTICLFCQQLTYCAVESHKEVAQKNLNQMAIQSMNMQIPILQTNFSLHNHQR